MKIALNKRDAKRVQAWATQNETTPERIIAWLIQQERIRAKTGPVLSDIMAPPAS